MEILDEILSRLNALQVQGLNNVRILNEAASLLMALKQAMPGLEPQEGAENGE